MITCKYSCDLCGLVDVEVDVLEPRPDQNEKQWLDETALVAIGWDHAMRSRDCYPDQLQRLMIPVPPNTESVGVPVVSH